MDKRKKAPGRACGRPELSGVMKFPAIETSRPETHSRALSPANYLLAYEGRIPRGSGQHLVSHSRGRVAFLRSPSLSKLLAESKIAKVGIIIRNRRYIGLPISARQLLRRKKKETGKSQFDLGVLSFHDEFVTSLRN